MDEPGQEQPKEEVPKKRNYLDKILLIIILILIAIFIRNCFVQDVSSEAESVKTDTIEIEENLTLEELQKKIDLKGRNINVEIIHHKNCKGCFFATDKILQYLKKLGCELTVDEKYLEDSEENKEFVGDLGVTKLPVTILRGEIEGLDKFLTDFGKKDDLLFIESPAPPYYSIPLEKIIGYAEVIYLKDKSCTLCPKIGEFLSHIQQMQGVYLTEKRAVYPNMTEWDELVEKYNITKIPTFIFKGDLLEFKELAKSWDKVGSIEADGSLIIREVKPPFKNPQTGEMGGLIDVIFLIEPSCTDCFDVKAAVAALKAKYDLVFGTSRTLDMNGAEGKDLIEKYNIKKAPTFILSEDAQYYPKLMEEWEKYGEISEEHLIFTKY